MKKITVFSYSFFTYKKATKKEIEVFESTYKKYFNYKYEISFDKRNTKMYETIFKFENAVDFTEKELFDFLVICFNLSNAVSYILTNKNYDGFETDVCPNSKDIDLPKIIQLATIMSEYKIIKLSK
jgi:NADH:ubiquinone oxidoreductase subunit C